MTVMCNWSNYLYEDWKVGMYCWFGRSDDGVRRTALMKRSQNAFQVNRTELVEISITHIKITKCRNSGDNNWETTLINLLFYGPD